MEPVIYTVGENQTDFHDFASSEVSSEVEQGDKSTNPLF